MLRFPDGEWPPRHDGQATILSCNERRGIVAVMYRVRGQVVPHLQLRNLFTFSVVLTAIILGLFIYGNDGILASGDFHG